VSMSLRAAVSTARVSLAVAAKRSAEFAAMKSGA